jgi:hypothetical protein
VTAAAALLLAITFQPPVFGPPCHAYQAAAGDLDRDGRDEFAVACRGGPDLVVRFTDEGVLETVWTSPESDRTECVTWGDYDDDGDVDLATAGNGRAVRVYRNDRGVLNLAWTAAAETDSKDCEFADIDGDGDLDLIVVGSGTDQIYLNERGGFLAPRSVFLGDETDDVALFDFDQDGDLDLLAATSDPSAPELLFRNEGGSLLRHWESPGGMEASAVAWADYDRDGRVDFAIVRPNDPDEIWRQSAPGEFERVLWNNPVSHSREVLWADFDRDHWPDLIIGQEGPLTVWRNKQTQLLLQDPLAGPGDLVEALAVGDADGDGKLDLFVGARNPDRKAQPFVRLYLGGEAPRAAPVEDPDPEDLLKPHVPVRELEPGPSLASRLLGLLVKTLLLAAILYGGWRASEFIKTLDKP